ncbi:MAG: GIY-YIG nuclease family protein [Chloroflexi bacterium]|nr:GIY-YIG nuclease family protein [Chloroflexota bacterium]MYF82429.1 GIY-YIG nuclease family protein [Chloroflexota bacterium]MYI05464.1 GIY-YIG nuclease family protein [Chloroflexota bacterium]
MRRREPAVYIITNKPKGTLYIGVTSNLPQRIWTHKQRLVEGFAKRYGLDQLVWYEYHDNMEQAILKEKQLKKWERPWKFRLIFESNPTWRDLFEDLA